MLGSTLRGVMGVLALACAASALAGHPPMPFESPWQHLGVATCAGSNCHGSQRPFDDSPVMQNEYFTWERKDAHSNAFKLLQGADGKRIADNLGIKDATKAEECLVCHTDYVAPAQRGRRYAMSEGVACEACHGGAQDWLGPHVSGNSHQQNLDAGLYPLEDPVARTRLCLQCHLGTGDKPIDHRIMGAGHPPLEFEVGAFTLYQPEHFRVDADYLERKPAHVSGARLWAIGQIVAAQLYLEELRSPRFKDHGLFPELVFFDCNACHHPMRPPRWSTGTGGALDAGEPRLMDAYLVMSGAVLTVLTPDASGRWQDGLRGLQQASRESVGKIQERAAALSGLAEQSLQQVGSQMIDKAQTIALMQQVARLGAGPRAADYTSAKQIYYAIDSLLADLKRQHGVGKDALNAEMDLLFTAFDPSRPFDPAALRKTLQQISQRVTTL